MVPHIPRISFVLEASGRISCRTVGSGEPEMLFRNEHSSASFALVQAHLLLPNDSRMLCCNICPNVVGDLVLVLLVCKLPDRIRMVFLEACLDKEQSNVSCLGILVRVVGCKRRRVSCIENTLS